MGPIELVFLLSMLLIFYTYAGYPLFLWVRSRFTYLDVREREISPFVSVVLTVLNEEANVRRRIENLLAQDYPMDKIEIIVVSDGSTDKTCDIVMSFTGPAVSLVMLDERHGKAFALNVGIARARGEIIVFADARQRFERDAVSRLVAYFNDPAIGCVSGELIFLQEEGSTIHTEMGAYWTYEKWIRKKESLTGSVVGATGAIYAIRKELYKTLLPETLLDDVVTPLNAVLQGFRCVFAGSALAYDVVSKDVSMEWRRKVRTLAGNWQLLALMPHLLLPWRNPCWWRFLSHKLLRLLVPFALVLLLASSILLPGGFYRSVAAVQLLVYALALVGHLVPAARTFRAVNMSYFFLVMNVAAACGFWWWITGRCATAWRPAAVG